MLVMVKRAADGMDAVGGLIRQVHEAASDAADVGYPRLARLLDDCGFALGACAPSKRGAIEARARKALAVWTILRSF